MSKITVFEHLRACAEEARDYAGGLVAKLAKTATEAIEELEQAKADRAQSVAVTIPATGWQSETGGDYPHYYDIAADRERPGGNHDCAGEPRHSKDLRAVRDERDDGRQNSCPGNQYPVRGDLGGVLD